MTYTSNRFDYFVVIAGMRTGSNLLEERLNEHPELTSLGELFNPHFVGGPNREEALGITRAARNAAPLDMVRAVAAIPKKLAGFRLFDGHDGRVLEHVLRDQRCAKIILSRNPLDSFVSLQIARETKQWWLGKLSAKRTAKVTFDGDDFRIFLNESEAFQSVVRRILQTVGQTGFALDYSELSDVDVLNGLVRYLGCEPVKWKMRPKAKVQNPGPIEDKLNNPEDLEKAVSRMDRFDTDRIPDYEPLRGVGAPNIRVAPAAGLAFFPVGGVAVDVVEAWLTQANGGAPPARGMSQKELKAWFKQTPHHRAFTVIEHPFPRAFEVFSRRILGANGVFDGPLIEILSSDFGLDRQKLSDAPPPEDLRASFRVFIDYIKATLSGQTGHRIAPDWASQTAIIEGATRLRIPDMVIRKSELEAGLAILKPEVALNVPPADPRLSVVYDAGIEKLCRAAYRRDYAFLGFDDWAV